MTTSKFSKPVCRRLLWWAAAVGLIVGLLLVEILAPHWRFWPSLGGSSAAVFLAVFLAALGCEFIDSALGMGYGTTLTPVLLLVGFTPLQVVPCVLLSELMTGIAAAFMHQRDGNVDFLHDRQARGVALLLSLLSAFGALLAVTVALSVPRVWLNGIISVIIVSVGITVLATLGRPLRYHRRNLIIIGTVAAFNKGLSGGGYGPLTTAGQIVSGVSSKQAVAVTSMAESLTCLLALSAYLVMQGNLDWGLAVPLALGALLSVPMATMTVRVLPEKLMRAGVGTLTCLLGLLMLTKLLI